MIVRPQITVAQLIDRWKAEEDPSQRQYATFKIFDRKNNVNVETSCAPGFISNYFQDNNLPWEISPAFFSPDVLHRFKADPERFTLEDRSITCRGTWHLKSYDINEAGQVHAYIGDLANLPYKQQLYWQSFNEWPRGSISTRAYTSDILGEWTTEYDALWSLKRKIQSLDKAAPPWWNPRGDAVAGAVRYPATDSPKEWADEVMALDQLLVEGFATRALQDVAQVLCRELEPNNWGSLKLLHEVLVGIGMNESIVKPCLDPMSRLHRLRTEIKGHATVSKKRAAESDARARHGNFRAHFTNLATECDMALGKVMAALDFVVVA